MSLYSLPFTGKTKNLKDQIIMLLSPEWPLSTNSIFSEIKKGGMNVTYQAVYKTLKEMADSGMIEKNKGLYNISEDWAKEFKGFFDRILNHTESSYLPKISDFKNEGEIKVFEFRNLEEMEVYRKRIQLEFIRDFNKMHPYCSISFHLKSPIIFSEKSLGVLENINKTKTLCYLLIRGDTPVDRWCASYYTNDLVSVKTGSSSMDSSDMMVLDDVIIQCFMPKEIVNEMERIYKKSNDMNRINIPEFYKNVYKKMSSFSMVIQRNTDLASAMRNNIINRFKEGVAVFDVDETIISGYLIVDFSSLLASRGMFKESSLEIMKMMIEDYKNGKASYESVVNDVVIEYAKGIRSQKVEKVKEMANRFSKDIKVKDYIKNLIPVIKNKRIVLISASPIEVVSKMNVVFPADDFLATKLEERDGVYTGEIILNMGLAGTKSSEFQRFMKSAGISIKGSLGFGNTIHDMEFLELVETPVVVFPDKELRKNAEKRKWLVIDDKNNKLEGL